MQNGNPEREGIKAQVSRMEKSMKKSRTDQIRSNQEPETAHRPTKQKKKRKAFCLAFMVRF